MFTFREGAREYIHPHRLLYVHSNQTDRNFVATTQRFKTEVLQAQQLTDPQGFYFTTKTNNNKTSRYSSQQKIKYFDLDLKSLVDSTTISSERQEGLFVNASTERQQKKDNAGLRQKQFNISAFKDLKSKNLDQKKRLLPENKKPVTKEDVQKCNDIMKELQNLVENQYIGQLSKVVKVGNLKKVKNIGQNNKQFKQKYSKINMGHYKPYQRVIAANYFKNKPIKAKELKEELELKRIQRHIIGKNGSEYKITIQKIF